MRVRDAVPDDAGAIAGVHVRGWQAAYRGQMPDAYLDGLDVAQRERAWGERLGAAVGDRPGRTLVAEDGGRVVGFAGVGPADDDDAEPTTGEGIGTALLARAEQALREAGYEHATLWVLSTNAGAIAFYERAGWRADGARTDQLIGGLSLPSVRYRTRLA